MHLGINSTTLGSKEVCTYGMKLSLFAFHRSVRNHICNHWGKRDDSLHRQRGQGRGSLRGDICQT